MLSIKLCNLVALLTLLLSTGPALASQRLASQSSQGLNVEQSPSQVAPISPSQENGDFGRPPAFPVLPPGTPCRGDPPTNCTCVDGVWYSNTSVYFELFNSTHLESPLFVDGDIEFHPTAMLSISLHETFSQRCLNYAWVTVTGCFYGSPVFNFFTLHNKDVKEYTTNLALYESATSCAQQPKLGLFKGKEDISAHFNGPASKCHSLSTKFVSTPGKCFHEDFLSAPAGGMHPLTELPSLNHSSVTRRFFTTAVFTIYDNPEISPIKCNRGIQAGIGIGGVFVLAILIVILVLLCSTAAARKCCQSCKESNLFQLPRKQEQYAAAPVSN